MTDNAPLTRTDLIEAMSKGIKPKDQWRIGAEHEVRLRQDHPGAPRL